jgi:two-component system phosphate regulon sensor histidine kinase PhoR
MAGKLGDDIGRLKKLERIRSEFLGNVSHELRTPIFSLQGFLETLLDGAIDDPAVNREFLEKAHRHAQRLNLLLNDLIEISRIESGEMQMSFRYFAIREFLERMLEEMRPQADQKGVALTLVPGAPAGEQVFGDRDRLKQVIVNLIDNAIKYTNPGGTIALSAEADGDRCTVRVSDTGIGIPEEHHSRIFERFYRVDRDRSRDVGGTGLGLAIVKHIIEAHGGAIAVASTPGKGSVFSFTLKRSA